MNILSRAKNHIKKTQIKLKNHSFIFSYSLVSKNADKNIPSEVSFDSFKEQIKYLNGKYNILTMDKLIENLNLHRLKKNSMVLTFDIGYQETIELIVPFLKTMQIPAIFFMRNDDKWEEGNILIDDILKEIFLGESSSMLQGNLMNYSKSKKHKWTLGSRVEKIEAFHRMLRLIYSLEKSKRIDQINSLIELCHLNLKDKVKYRISSKDHLKEVLKNKLFTPGINFNFFAGSDRKYQFNEMMDGKNRLELEINYKIKYCSYYLLDPENYWIDKDDLFKSLEFKAACFNLPSLIRNNTDIYRIPRFNPGNLDLRNRKFFKQLLK